MPSMGMVRLTTMPAIRAPRRWAFEEGEDEEEEIHLEKECKQRQNQVGSKVVTYVEFELAATEPTLERFQRPLMSRT